MRKSPDSALASLHSPQGGGRQERPQAKEQSQEQAAGTPAPTRPASVISASAETPGTPGALDKIEQAQASAVVDNATTETPLTQNTESEPSLDGQVIDPAKPLVLRGADGKEERLTWEQLQSERYNYNKYMAERSKLDVEKKDLADKQRAAEDALAWQDKAARDPYVGVYLQRIAGGATPEEAARAAAAATGVSISNAAEPKKKSAADLRPPNNDTDSDEYAEWYAKTYLPALVDETAEKKAEAIINQRLAPIESELKGYREQSTRSAEEVKQHKARIERNTQTIGQFHDIAYRLKGIVTSQLAPEEFNAFGVELTRAFQERGVDITREDVLANTEIHPDTVEIAVRNALDRFRPKPTPVKSRTQQDPPLNAAPQSGASDYRSGGGRPRAGYAPKPIAALNALHNKQH